MFYKVEYKNPNNINDITYTYETRSKVALDKWLKHAREYSGSYNVLNVEKISEAGGKKNENI